MSVYLGRSHKRRPFWTGENNTFSIQTSIIDQDTLVVLVNCSFKLGGVELKLSKYYCLTIMACVCKRLCTTTRTGVSTAAHAISLLNDTFFIRI